MQCSYATEKKCTKKLYYYYRYRYRHHYYLALLKKKNRFQTKQTKRCNLEL